MKKLEEMLEKFNEKYKNSKTVEVYEEQLDSWFKIIDELREENKKLKENYAKLDKVASENVRTLDELEAKRIELEEENEKLRTKCRRLEKEYKNLQVEHSRLLFDMDAVIEHEVDVKYSKLKEEVKELRAIIKHYKKYKE
jgi:uncharacterized protein YigA (DUF484 family)